MLLLLFIGAFRSRQETEVNNESEARCDGGVIAREEAAGDDEW